MRQALNQGLEIRGVVITMFDGRVALSGQVVAEVRKHFGPKVFDTVVPRSVRLAEAPSHGMPITAYAPTSPGGVAYKALAEELLRGDQPPAASEPLKAAVVLEPKAPALATTSVEDTQPVDASLSDPTNSADAAGPTDLGDAVPEGPVASSSSTKRGLGRGLDALIPTTGFDTRPSADATGEPGAPAAGTAVIEAPIGSVTRNPRQPPDRVDRQALQVATSIREHGVLQPLVVSPGDGPDAMSSSRASGVSKPANSPASKRCPSSSAAPVTSSASNWR